MMPQRGSWNSSPPLISPPLLIILLPILALTLLFITVPPILSAATNVLRPASVKTSWDSLNILIVVFAILFGVFARRNDDEPSTPQNTNDVVQHQNDAYIRVSSEGSGTSGYESRQWYGFSEESKVYDDATLNRLQTPVTGVSQLRRRSSSYPDLRQLATGDDSYKFRFFDDYEIDKQFRSPAREQFSAMDHRKRWPEDQKQEEEEEEVSVKEIPVDTFETRSSPPVKSPAPAPPPPPPPPPLPPQDSARRHPRQMHRKVESVREITETDDREFIEVQFPPPDPPTPPPPRPSAKTRSEQRSGKTTERRKSNVKREIAMVWASVLSNQRKRKKKQRTKNDHDHNHHYDNVEVNELTNNTIAPPTPPPPPPPPPPPSVFHSIFRKGLSKNKKIHSVSTSTPPAPPPPPSLTSSRRWSKRKNQIPPPPTPPRRGNSGKPPLPNKTSNNIINETINVNAVGNQSPLIPPPPPPPPFKIAAMKFSVRGDFVKIGSNQSSQCSSPEREHIDVELSETTITPTPVTVTTVNNSVTDSNGHVSGSVFCPSPDVNVKAATFIARLRGEWRLEKLNSIKEKGNASLPLARGYTL